MKPLFDLTYFELKMHHINPVVYRYGENKLCKDRRVHVALSSVMIH